MFLNTVEILIIQDILPIKQANEIYTSNSYNELQIYSIQMYMKRTI